MKFAVKKKIIYIISIVIISLGSFSLVFFNKMNENIFKDSRIRANKIIKYEKELDFSRTEYIEAFIPTFLGNFKNTYYGNNPGSKLNLIWKTFLGSGKTIVSNKEGLKIWAGAGWTGQPLLIREEKKLFLIIGCFDHNLKKIDAFTGEIIWEYKFDDIIKGTGTYWENTEAKSKEERYVILQGSRKGIHKSLNDNGIHSFRAISFISGKELWRFSVKKTASYSCDVDASALVFNDTIYIGFENGLFTVINPRKLSIIKGYNYPELIRELFLFEKKDISLHGGNLVTEASVVRLNNHIYIASGSGHIYGYNLLTNEIDWDYKIAADLNGSPVVTSDNAILIPIEKQYIPGKGGVLKLNPAKPANESVEWFFPTENNNFAKWEGGVIGSVSVNDTYKQKHHLAAFTGIDGYLYVVDYSKTDSTKTTIGPNLEEKIATPVLIFEHYIGPSISTPLLYENRLLAASYNGVYLFSYDDSLNFKLLVSKPGVFEATPIANDSCTYLASRDGYLYCLGNSDIPFDSVEKNLYTVEIEEDFVEKIQETILLPEIAKHDSLEIISRGISQNSTLLKLKSSEQISFIERVNCNSIVNSKKHYIETKDSLLGIDTIQQTFVKLEMVSSTISTIQKALLDQFLYIRPLAKLVAVRYLNNKKDVKPEEIQQTKTNNFHVIAGSFSIKDNAIRFSQKLRDQGYNSKMFGPHKGFWYVPYYSFSSRELAVNKLKGIHNSVNKEAWILEY